MKKRQRYLQIAAVLALLNTTPFALAEGKSAPATEAPPAAASFYLLVGSWKGEAQMQEAGKQPVKLKAQVHCQKVSSGYGVSCNFSCKNKEMSITESDLFGVDAATGVSHWYAVTNQGESHDHIVQWVDKTHMKASYPWEESGKKMEEQIEITLTTPKSVQFRSVVTADGQEVISFSGTLKRQPNK